MDFKTVALTIGIVAGAIKIYDFAEDFFKSTKPEQYREQLKQKYLNSLSESQIIFNQQMTTQRLSSNLGEEMLLSEGPQTYIW